MTLINPNTLIHRKLEFWKQSSRGKQTKDAKRPRQDSSEGEITNFLCQPCDTRVEDGINCTGCKLLFCLRCAQISPGLHKCMKNGEMDSFHWNCRSCNSSFPSLENITGVLKNIQSKFEGRMSNIETRMDSYEERTEKIITDQVTEMKDDIKDSLKGEVNQLVGIRNRELEDRKRRKLNLTVFNLPEHSKQSGQENREEDEIDFASICADLGLSSVNIQTSLRLGKKMDNKTRPLKVILTDKAQRKFLLDNAKMIPIKVCSIFSRVIFSKDLTPQQRDEKRKLIKSKRESRQRQDYRPNQHSHSSRGQLDRNRPTLSNPLGNVPPQRVTPMPQNQVNPGSERIITSPSFHSTLLLGQASNKSPRGMEVDNHISPIASSSAMSQLNPHIVSPKNDTVLQLQNDYDDTTLIDVENQNTVIGGTQVSYHEESEPPKQSV